MQNNNSGMFGLIGLGVILVLAVSVFFGSWTIVGPQEQGIVVRMGSIGRTLDSGFHFKIPFMEGVVKIDTSTQALAVDEMAYSKDGQIISFQATVNYSVQTSFANTIYKEFKKDYETRFIIPLIKESIKTVGSNYTAQGIIDSRAKLPTEMKALFTQGVGDRGFTVSGITLTNIDFDDAYENAIKNKQVQEQQALAQVNVTKQEEEKKKQEILKAGALAEKTRLEAVALQSAQGEKVIDKIYAEAALEASKKWNGVLPTQFVPGSALPFIQVGR